MKKNKILILAAALVMLVAAAGLITSCAKKPGEKQLWTCPMHPYYIADKPGDCPICGMKLIKVDKTDESGMKSQIEEKSSMSGMPGMEPVKNPSDSTGQTKPIKNFSDTTGTSAKHEAPADRVTVKIDSEKQQLINVRTDIVAKRSLGNTVLASGVVAYDPELYYTQQQYISAASSLRKAKADGDATDIASAKDALASSETRLKVMGLSAAQISDLSTKVEPDKSLLISDNGATVWIYAQVYQDDLKYVKRGAEAEITLSSSNGESYAGKVVAIDPALNPETRSVRVRILAKNTGNAFKPEMYVNVKIRSATGNYLSVPEDAIMDTGSKQIAFVDKGDGYFEPRYVVLEGKVDDYYIVKFGLSEGEKVVTNANFFIDSESQLKAALGGMAGHKH